jgi:two-component system NtrC family response regulator
VVRRDDLPLGPDTGTGGAPLTPSLRGSLAATLAAFEKTIVLDTLAACGGNQSEAARRLGLTESGLRYKLGKWRGDG